MNELLLLWMLMQPPGPRTDFPPFQMWYAPYWDRAYIVQELC